MSFPMGSKALPFGQRRRPHPLLGFAAATFGALGVIAAGWMFLSETVSEAAANAPAPRTDRVVWYQPAAGSITPAAELDIARSVPVKAELKAAAGSDAAIYTHKVGVEALRVRGGPKRTADQLFVLRAGTPVKRGAEQRGWVEITTEDGRTGWVFAQFLNPRQG